MKMTNKQIRETLIDRPEVLAVRITAAGEVNVKTDEPRGDGGPTPWWKFIGYRDEVIRDLSA